MSLARKELSDECGEQLSQVEFVRDTARVSLEFWGGSRRGRSDRSGPVRNDDDINWEKEI
jgi:hypothetical protein